MLSKFNPHHKFADPILCVYTLQFPEYNFRHPTIAQVKPQYLLKSAYKMASNDTSITYKIIRISRNSTRLSDLVGKIRATRLNALINDPSSFLAQYSVESALPISVWTKRISSETTILICVVTNKESALLDDESALIECEWAGFAAIRGPMEYEDYYSSPDMGLQMPSNPSEETRWHIYDLYTLPVHRGRNLAKRLINSCIEIAVEYTKGLYSHKSKEMFFKIARIRLFMNPKTTWLSKMYERLGFKAGGRVTLAEGFRANVMDESVPEDTRSTEELRSIWHTRYGLAMEQVINIE